MLFCAALLFASFLISRSRSNILPSSDAHFDSSRDLCRRDIRFMAPYLAVIFLMVQKHTVQGKASSCPVGSHFGVPVFPCRCISTNSTLYSWTSHRSVISRTFSIYPSLSQYLSASFVSCQSERISRGRVMRRTFIPSRWGFVRFPLGCSW